MSSTRRAPKGAPLRQEKFASSASLQKGFLGNLVARRLEGVPQADARELVWWAQDFSFRRPGEPHYTCGKFNNLALSPLVPDGGPFAQLAADLTALFPEHVRGRPLAVQRELLAKCVRLCLDPRSHPAAIDGKGACQFLPALREYKVRLEAAHLAGVAETAVKREVWDGLDFCLSQRGLVLMEGTYRSGKTLAAQAWCMARPGRARFVSLRAYSDTGSFMRTLAVSLGLAASVQRKATETRARIEDTLKGRDLMLVLDECEQLAPSGKAGNASADPERLRFLISLDNLGVPVALLGSRNFSKQLAVFESRVPSFGMEQIYGRFRLRKQLADSLAEPDLSAIAERIATDADAPTRKLLVGHTLGARGRVAALETALQRARYFAAGAGRSLAFEDVERAIEESAPARPFTPRPSVPGAPPAPSAPSAPSAPPAPRAPREPSAPSPRTRRDTAASVPGRRTLAPI